MVSMSTSSNETPIPPKHHKTSLFINKHVQTKIKWKCVQVIIVGAKKKWFRDNLCGSYIMIFIHFLEAKTQLPATDNCYQTTTLIHFEEAVFLLLIILCLLEDLKIPFIKSSTSNTH